MALFINTEACLRTGLNRQALRVCQRVYEQACLLLAHPASRRPKSARPAYRNAAWAAAKRAIGTRKGEQLT